MKIDDEVAEILKNYHFYKTLNLSQCSITYLNDKLNFIEQSVSVLPIGLKEIVEMVYYNKIKVAQIAKSLYISRQTVYNRMNYAIKQIGLAYSTCFSLVKRDECEVVSES